MSGWRHHLLRATGSGLFDPVLWDAPLSGVVLSEDLSGPGGVDCTVSPEHPNLSRGMLVPWSTVIVSELEGQIRGVNIVENVAFDGPSLSVSGIGLAGYPGGQGWTAKEFQGVEVDPMDMVRKIWAHVQGEPGGNLGILVDATTSPVRIGEEPRDVEFETGDGEVVEFEAGPYVLAWWKTDDMGKALDDLAAETPFDYRMQYRWTNKTAGSFESRLRLGYPQLGTRRNGARFVVGENVTEVPKIDHEGASYCSHVVVIGAGEGREARRGNAPRIADRLRRVRTIADKSKSSNKAAQALAEETVKASTGVDDITEITVRDHDNARLGTWDVGDEILIQTPDGWAERMRMWVRVLSQSWDCEADRMTMTVVRAEKRTS